MKNWSVVIMGSEVKIGVVRAESAELAVDRVFEYGLAPRESDVIVEPADEGWHPDFLDEDPEDELYD